jgi:hypothetical protein
MSQNFLKSILLSCLFSFCLMAGAAVDLTAEIERIKRSAEAGNANAQNTLGSMYASGEVVPKNAAKAVEWFRKAAEKGLADAQWKLGLMYENGDGVVQDKVEAMKWYKKSATQGNAWGQTLVGLAYAARSGVAQTLEDIVQNTEEAIAWLSKAAAQGNETAQKQLSDLRQSRHELAQLERERRERRLSPGGGVISVKLDSDGKSCITFTNNCTYTRSYRVLCQSGGVSLFERWDYGHGRLEGWEAYYGNNIKFYSVHNGYGSVNQVAAAVCSGL